MASSLLRHQDSDLESHHGFIWGFLHFFGLQHHFHLKELLDERKRYFGKPSKHSKSRTIPSSYEQLEPFSMEDDDPMEDKFSIGSSLKSLISKRLSKKPKKKKKIGPASKLQRTLSFHHKDCDDYVLPDDPIWDSEAPAVEVYSSETDSSSGSDGVASRLESFGSSSDIQVNKLENQFLENQSILMEKLVQAKKQMNAANSNRQGEHAKIYEAKDFMDVFELLDANSKLFHKMLQDSCFVDSHDVQDRDSSGPDSLMKCGSFPRFTGRKSCGFSRFKQFGEVEEGDPTAMANGLQVKTRAHLKLDAQKSEISGFYTPRSSSEFDFVASPLVLKSPRYGETTSESFKDFKQRIKEVLKEAKNEGARVPLDGVLHKIPYGHKITEELKDESCGILDGTSIDRNGRGTRKYGFVPKDNKARYRGFRRSHSLTSDSLDKYTRLFESSSFKEPHRHTTGMNSSQGASLVSKPARRWGRTVSNPEFFRSLDHLEVDETLSVNENFMKKSSDPLNCRPHQTLESSRRVKLPSIEENANETEDDDPRQPEIIDFNDPNEEYYDIIEENLDGTEVADLSQQLKIDIDGPNEASEFSDKGSDRAALIEGNVLIEEFEVSKDQEKECTFAYPDNLEDKPEKPSPDSVLDFSYREEPISPVKCSLLEENLQISSLVNPQEQCESDAGIGRQPVPKIDDDEALYGSVDEDDAPEFNYVKGVMKKCSSGNEEFLPRWCLEHPSSDPPQSGDAKGSTHLIGLAEGWPDMPADSRLLFDLINEVLLEIYASSSFFCHGFSHFHRRIRPMPVGRHVLEEVWASISWHLASQSRPNPTFDDAVARDFSKQDGWMNIRQDTDFLNLELEAWILDDLLDEVLDDIHVF